MYLADYHVHSACSPDGHQTMAQAAQAAFSLPENLDASLQNLSWDGLCRRLLDDMTEQAV